MKKILIVLLGFLLMGSIANASLINWTSTQLSNDPDVGSLLQAGWLVAMYQDVNEDNGNSGNWFNELRLDNSGVVTSLGWTSDDILLTPVTSLEYFIAWTQVKTVTNVSVTDNIDVYTVVFNKNNMGSATEFVVADASPFDVGVHDPATDYNLGSSIAGSFQAIPEPAVAGLLGIFGGGMLITRRIFKKEA